MPALDVSYRCHNCGQGWKLQQTDEFNRLAPTFCPICGTPTLERATSVMGTHEARCFKVTSSYRQLAEMLKYDWHYSKPVDGQPKPQERFPRFVDYLAHRLTSED